MDYYSLTDIKKKNRSDVYQYIYRNPNSPKQGIATALGISLPTVTQHLTALLNDGLIETCGQLSSSIGRKATAYTISATAKIAVGIEVLPTTVHIAGLNLYGQKETKEKKHLEFHPDAAYFEALKEIVTSFLEEHHYQTEQILGIGLGVQGLTSQNGEVITYGKILDCTNLSIEDFQNHFPLPCRFFHDAECAATSELWENEELNDCIYLSLGYHLGGAVILDGKLQRGITGKTGTFEHMTLVPGGKTCYCGKTGCAECYCSADALLFQHNMELDEFFSRKLQGDPDCVKEWDCYLSNLSLLINNIHMVMESLVILGGHITPYFTDADMEVLRNKVHELSAFQDSTAYILPGKCRNDAVSIGAALPFVKEYLDGLGEDVE